MHEEIKKYLKSGLFLVIFLMTVIFSVDILCCLNLPLLLFFILCPSMTICKSEVDEVILHDANLQHITQYKLNIRQMQIHNTHIHADSL